MPRTVMIHGSDGKVMAHIGDGNFIEGRRMDIVITACSADEDLPLAIREDLIGVTIPTIFSSEQVHGAGGAAPKGSRVAYGDEVAEALRAAGKEACADELSAVFQKNDPRAQYHFLIFKAGEYQPVAEE